VKGADIDNQPYGNTIGFCCCRTGAGAAIFIGEVTNMETRVAVMSIIVENPDAVEQLNAILHQHGDYIIGRMGIPYRKRKISIISIALDAPQDILSSLAGKIGVLPGISVKTAYSSVITKEERNKSYE
jgi:putative iron-only hydrogenase system regulator